MQKTRFELALAARKDARANVGDLRFSWPWALALSVSAAWAVLVFAIVGAYSQAGLGWAIVTGALLLTFPVFVSAYAVGIARVELARLKCQRALLSVPEPEQALEPEHQAEQAEAAELAPGLEVNGRMVSPTGEASALAVALRGECLTFVRAGLRRGSWSRSKIAEGPGALMRGEAWDRASRELQRLGYFGKGTRGALEPAREVGDMLRRLEAAR